MKKPPINKVEIAINAGAEGCYVGPRTKLRLIRNLLEEMDFRLMMSENKGHLPWRNVAKPDLARTGEPATALRGARIKEGLSQLELARRLKIAQCNLSKMENGARTIGKNMALRLSDTLNVDYRIFL